MHKLTKEYIVYDYNDILNNETLKKKVLEKHYDINVDFDDWDSCIIDDWTEKLTNIGFCNPKIYYSGFWSQGDGACFEISGVDWELLLKNYNCKHKQWILQFLQNYCCGYIRKNRFGYHYSHEKTRYFELENNCCFSYFRIENQLKNIENYIENLRYELSCQLYSDLEKGYDYLTSEAAILETIQANEYEFYSDGSIAC